MTSSASQNYSSKPITNDHFEALGQTWQLKRYPYFKQSQLRAWDSADHYLLETIKPFLAETQHLCILNDNFGALTVALAAYQPIGYGDSWMSAEATRLNFNANEIDEAFNFESDIDALVTSEQRPDLVIGRVPKSKSHLAYLLQQLNHWLDDGTPLFLAGMDKHLSKNQFELLDQLFGPAEFLPGVKKARVWKAVSNKQRQSKPVKALTEVGVPEFDLSLSAKPNVFSRDSLDIGSRFLLENLDKLPRQKQVADLACGNGVLGLAYLRRHPDAQMLFCDESFQAIQSVQENLKCNFDDVQAIVRADDGLKRTDSHSLDLVLCNPPFHQNNMVITDIASSLFKDAKRCLKQGGEFWIVANRHLGYHVFLKRLFGNCITETGNKKFVILKATK